MKRSSIVLLVTILTTIYQFFFLTGCEEEIYGYGYETNGIMEGTVWVRGNNDYISFSKNAVTFTHSLEDFGHASLPPGTYYSYFRDGYIAIKGPSREYGLGLNKYMLRYGLGYYESTTPAYYLPASGTLFINGKYLYFNDFGAEEIEGGLMMIKYTGNLKNLVIPAEIGGVPVVAIGSGTDTGHPFANDKYFEQILQLNSIIIPDNVKTIKPGVFRSRQLETYLIGGITIGANVTIMGANAGAGWDQGWGALDTARVGEGNFIAYESAHLGYWLDMGFTKFYNENGRKAGTYKWSSSYNSYNMNYTFTWSYTPAFIIER